MCLVMCLVGVRLESVQYGRIDLWHTCMRRFCALALSRRSTPASGAAVSLCCDVPCRVGSRRLSGRRTQVTGSSWRPGGGAWQM